MINVVSTPIGFSLVFETREELESVVRNLSGQLEWVDANNINPPFIYHTADESIPVELYDELTDKLKAIFSIHKRSK